MPLGLLVTDVFAPTLLPAGVWMAANLGGVVLMFAVGLESTVPQLMKVGLASLGVAVIGVVAPTGYAPSAAYASDGAIQQ